MASHIWTHRLKGLFVCVFLCEFGHTGVPLVLITEYKQAVRHSGCAERSFRTRSTGEDTLHDLLSSLETGQRIVRISLDPTQYSPDSRTRTVPITPSSMHSTATAPLLSSTAVCNSVPFRTAHTLLFTLLSNNN